MKPNYQTAAEYPIAANGALVDTASIARFLGALFGNVDWNGETVSLLGIGEKGTDREGSFRERKFVTAGNAVEVGRHARRWAEWHAATFLVPCVVHPSAVIAGDVTLERIAAMTAIILDLDSGDVPAKQAFVTARLGLPSIVVRSGGKTDEGHEKRHLYWIFNEPEEQVEQVAFIRKLLAIKSGGDPSFGRATQVIRIPGTVHAKYGNANLCELLECNDREYSFAELAEIVAEMAPMEGVPVPAPVPAASASNVLDFSAYAGMQSATDVMVQDVHEGGDEETNRWSAFNQVAGFNIQQVRLGNLTADEAFAFTKGWMMSHMIPPWPDARFQTEFRALWNHDIKRHGAINAPAAAGSSVTLDALFPIKFFADIKATLSNPWLVRDLLPRQGLAAMYGDPGCGKSFLAVDMALRIAAGMEIDGRPVKSCPVVYIAAEGATGLEKRIDAWRQYHDVGNGLPFALMPCAPDLQDPTKDLPRLVTTIDAAVERFGLAPGLIIVDTLSATFGGGDENGPAMTAYVNNLAKVRDYFHATVLAVHHRPKARDNNTLRGHGSLTGAMDTIIYVEAGAVHTAKITKQKDGEGNVILTFGLQSEILGNDEEGQPVASAIVKYLHPSTGKKLPKSAQQALDVLAAMIETRGGSGIPEYEWRELWYKNWSDEQHAAAKPETERKAWARLRKALLSAGRVEDKGGLWSIVPTEDGGCQIDFGIAAEGNQ